MPQVLLRWTKGILVLASLLLVSPVGSAVAMTCAGCMVEYCKHQNCGGCVKSATCRALIRDLCESGGFCNNVVLQPGFDDTADVTHNGKQLVVGGPIQCSAGERIDFIRIVVTQEGSVAEGHTKGGECTGSGDDDWQAVAHAKGKAFFGAGPAKVCGVAALESKDALATFQWCKDITLVPVD